jgi:hypothetical protein
MQADRPLAHRRVPVDDERWCALIRGLDQLDATGLRRVLARSERSDGVVLDTYNYDADRGLWCPLAAGLDVDEFIEPREKRSLDDSRAKGFIIEVGRFRFGAFSLNPLSGVPGVAFREHRREDLRQACRQLLDRKEEAPQSARGNISISVAAATRRDDWSEWKARERS